MKKLIACLIIVMFFCNSFMAQTPCEIVHDQIGGSKDQNICNGVSIIDINFSVNGDNNSVYGLPPGINFSVIPQEVDKNIVISGAGEASGLYTYTVVSYGTCTGTITTTGTILVGSALLTANDSQLVCRNQAIQPIKYKYSGYVYGSNLPDGLVYSTSGDTLTIQGIPTNISGDLSSYYLYNSCEDIYGKIIVGVGLDDNSSGFLPVCKGDAMDEIKYTFAGGQAQVYGLPEGITTTTLSSSMLKISGQSSVEGLYTYTVVNSGGACSHPVSAIGKILVGGGFEGTSSLRKICPEQELYGVKFYVVGENYTITGLPNGFEPGYYYGEEVGVSEQSLVFRGQSSPGYTTYTIYDTAQSNHATGSYNYTITTDGYCAVPSSFLGVLIVKPMDVSVLTINASSANSCDGYLEATVDEVGTAPFSYWWNTNDNTKIISNACVGSYSVTVTDNNGCMALSNASIGVGSSSSGSDNSLKVLVYSSATSALMECDGKANAVISGGVPPYILTFGGQTISGITSHLFEDLCAGFYTINVSDSQSNSASFTFVVASPDYIFNSIADDLLNAAFTGTLVANAQSNCLINFDKIDSIKITDFKIVNNNTLNVTWSLYYKTSFVSMLVNYNYSLPGLYTLMLDVFCPNRSSGYVRGIDDLVIEDRTSTSIKAITPSELVCFPNPFSNELNVELTEESNIEITDVTGKIVISQNLIIGTVKINTASLAQGVYIIKVINSKGSIFKKLVKN